ncbi:hypothetical protein [Olivibacter jilunii]|uniref:hypothetical protein n=1 Tax=Olivibacter jilunii TaxID=985016 RepID=UPI003F140DF0
MLDTASRLPRECFEKLSLALRLDFAFSSESPYVFFESPLTIARVLFDELRQPFDKLRGSSGNLKSIMRKSSKLGSNLIGRGMQNSTKDRQSATTLSEKVSHV